MGGALLSNEKSHGIALEWAMSKPGHPMWLHCMETCKPGKRKDSGSIVDSTGPNFVKRCFTEYTNLKLEKDEKPKAGKYSDIMLLEKEFVSPISWWVPKKSPCLGVKWLDLEYFRTNFTKSKCRKHLEDLDSYAWTIYSSSWNPVDPPDWLKDIEVGARRMLEYFADWFGELVED